MNILIAKNQEDSLNALSANAGTIPADAKVIHLDYMRHRADYPFHVNNVPITSVYVTEAAQAHSFYDIVFGTLRDAKAYRERAATPPPTQIEKVL